MNKCRLLTVAAIALWIASLFLPVFGEAGTGKGNIYSGAWVLAWTFSLGLKQVVGNPWAIPNDLFSIMVWLNIIGVPNRTLAIRFLVFTAVMTPLTIAMGMDWPMLFWTGAGMWKIGVIPWFLAMYGVAGAGLITPNF